MTLLAYSTESSNQSTALLSYNMTVTVLQGQPAIPQNGYVSASFLDDSTTVVQIPVAAVDTRLSVSTVQPVAVTPLVSDTSLTMTVTATPVHVSGDDKPVTDEWLASLEKQAVEKWVI